MLFYEDKLLSTSVIRQQSWTARDSLSKAKLKIFSKRLILIYLDLLSSRIFKAAIT